MCALTNNRGRPKKVTQITTSSETQAEILNLRDELSFKNGEKMVLLVSFATNEMINQAMKYPEVFFIDCTSRANRQKRDLFVGVVRSPAARCFIMNVTVMPSGEISHEIVSFRI